MKWSTVTLLSAVHNHVRVDRARTLCLWSTVLELLIWTFSLLSTVLEVLIWTFCQWSTVLEVLIAHVLSVVNSPGSANSARFVCGQQSWKC